RQLQLHRVARAHVSAGFRGDGACLSGGHCQQRGDCTAPVTSFLLAFAAMALASVAVIVSNVVTGAVLASYREIGIVKALGFTPHQVVGAFVLTMLIPALLAGLIALPIGALAR